MQICATHLCFKPTPDKQRLCKNCFETKWAPEPHVACRISQCLLPIVFSFLTPCDQRQLLMETSQDSRILRFVLKYTNCSVFHILDTAMINGDYLTAQYIVDRCIPANMCFHSNPNVYPNVMMTALTNNIACVAQILPTPWIAECGWRNVSKAMKHHTNDDTLRLVFARCPVFETWATDWKNRKNFFMLVCRLKSITIFDYLFENRFFVCVSTCISALCAMIRFGMPFDLFFRVWYLHFSTTFDISNMQLIVDAAINHLCFQALDFLVSLSSFTLQGNKTAVNNQSKNDQICNWLIDHELLFPEMLTQPAFYNQNRLRMTQSILASFGLKPRPIWQEAIHQMLVSAADNSGWDVFFMLADTDVTLSNNELKRIARKAKLAQCGVYGRVCDWCVSKHLLLQQK